jgi:hypothetical protein
MIYIYNASGGCTEQRSAGVKTALAVHFQSQSVHVAVEANVKYYAWHPLADLGFLSKY